MIISHKYKYIFLKPRKVAGTSLQVSLAKHCGPDDIVTPTTSFTKDVDDDEYNDHARNYDGYFNHMRPSRIRQKVGQKVWNEYFIFSIVRNPWDMLVSRYFWNKRALVKQQSPKEIGKDLLADPFNIDLYGKMFFALDRDIRGKKLKENDDFKTFLKKLPSNASNSKYYFGMRGEIWNDYVLRFENLNDDYQTLCEKIGVPFEPLLSLKTKTRKKRDYRESYNEETKAWVAKKFAKEIEYFGYTFERK